MSPTYIYINMKHIYQPDGISCGPTCLKMASEFVSKNIGNIQSICSTCGTDSTVGTPPDKMIVGLDKFGFNYKIHMDDQNPYDELRTILDQNSIAILRTITHGVPHWIIVKGHNDNEFQIFDPWLGIISYDEDQLSSIWKVRNHFFFEIKGINNEHTNNGITVQQNN